MRSLLYLVILLTITACNTANYDEMCSYYGNCEEEKSAQCSIWGNCDNEAASAEGCGIYGCSNTQKKGECGIWGCGGHANPGSSGGGSIYGTTSKKPDAGATGGLGW